MNLQGSIRIPRRPSDGKDGINGSNGLPGQIPIQKEWVVGDAHRNTDEIVDYIYARGADKETSYWYKLSTKGTKQAGNPPQGGTTPSGYERIDWLKELAVQVLIAEEANVAGFIFKNRKLISQDGDGSIEDYASGGFEPNFEVDGRSGRVKMKDAEIEGTITGSIFTSKDGKVVVDGISNQIYLKDADSDEVRTILSPRKLPLTPSSYFGSSSPTNVSLGSLQKSYSKNSSSVNLITIPSGDSSAYQITIPQMTINVNVDHPGDLGGGGMIHMNSASIEVGIYKGGILQYLVDSVSARSSGGVDTGIKDTPLSSYTIQGSGTWSVRVTHKHTISQFPSSSVGNVMGIYGNAIVAKVVNSSAIGSNGMIIATSGTEYTYMVGDTYEVRRGNVGFKITKDGVQKSSNMNLSNPTWNPI